MKNPQSIMLIAMGVLALSACQKPAVDSAAIADELKRDATEWADAYNAGDADRIAGMYAADGMVMPPHHAAVQGADAIRQFITEDTANAKANGATLAINSTSSGASGDLAWHSGTFTVTDASGATLDNGKYVELRQNVDGQWKIVRDIWNSDRAMPQPAAEAPAT
jgi:uncharacterized protein (TIGR02246 family)